MSDYVSETSETNAPNSVTVDDKEVDPARAALVKKWIARVKADKKHFEPAFKRMRTCMKIAADGTDEKEWVDNENYIVPVINRHINQAVATLYARNPKSVAKKKQKLLYQIWDGDPQSLQQAEMAVQQAQIAPPIVDPLSGALVPAPIDPQAIALLQEVQQAKQQLLMYDRLAKTMELLFAHYLDEQDNGYKEQIKGMVRRAKVCGVSYIQLGFQRQLKKDADIEGRIADATDQIARIEVLMAQMKAGDVEKESAKAEELRLLVADLQQKVEIIAREGPTLSFPRATDITPDKRCRHLKTFTGARWVTHEFHMEPDDVQETYGVSLKTGQFKAYTPDEGVKADGQKVEEACIWEIQDKSNGQCLTVCEGYSDFLKEPYEPDVKIERFWTLFPLVFNEIESEEQLFPPSDVWMARHMQRDYNSAGQGRREHRISARPRYATVKGKLEKVDKDALSTSPAHTIIEISALLPGEDIEKVLQRVPVANIDPSLYETETVFQDIMRAVGSQEANLGGVSGATATETSIAENSRMSASADNVDDLDTMLTQLARGMGQLMLLELSIDTVREIAGPGAVWPAQAPTREEIVKDLLLEIEAGSSGRPNKAAKLADFERAAPYLIQLPGVNPIPFVKKALDLLDIDLEEGVAEGMPSIAALNSLAGTPPPPLGGPAAQGPQGGNNQPQPGGNEPGAQPAYPAPAPAPGAPAQ
jgi:hypothetical protein